MVGSVQFSPRTDWVVSGFGDLKDDLAEVFIKSFLREAIVSNAGMGRMSTLRRCPSSIFSADHGVALQGVLKDGFGEAVVACDMPEPCKFPSLGRLI